MWDNDPIFEKILKTERIDTSFKRISSAISSADADTAESLLAAFVRTFRGQEAGLGRNVVFIWSVDQPYSHTEGHCLPSSIINIEKTKNTIATRWSQASLIKLTTDFTKREVVDINNLGHLALANRNLSFYQRIVRENGPLRISWCEATTLNAASGGELIDSSRHWEQKLIKAYKAEHNCFPLKNRRH